MSRTDLIKRIRGQLAAGHLPEMTQQLLRDVEATLVRDPSRHGAALELARESPKASNHDALIAAALDYAAEVDCDDFMLTLPNTTPELVIAFGEPLPIINVLADHVRFD